MNIQVKVIEIIKEDAYANASNVGGMGSVTAAQPSLNAGSTIGSAFTSGGGTVGSGDVGGGHRRPYKKSGAGRKRKGKKSKGRPGKTELFQQKQNWTHGGDKPPKLKKFSDFEKVTYLTN
jgi:hypothetical protein